MEQNESVEKNAMLTCVYGPMYLQLDDYPPYTGKNSDIFETHINSNLRCIHGYTNCMRHTDLITWVSNSARKMLISQFIHAVKISPCPRTTVCNKCAQSNTSDDILITGDNTDDEEIVHLKNLSTAIEKTNRK